MKTPLVRILLGVAAAALADGLRAQTANGYYRFPAIHGDTIVFAAEGDLWRVAAAGGTAQRLTSHPGQETYPAISHDGKWVAFSAQYEGTNEVYVMPLTGGLPKRLTFEGESALVRGWAPGGHEPRRFWRQVPRAAGRAHRLSKRRRSLALQPCDQPHHRDPDHARLRLRPDPRKVDRIYQLALTAQRRSPFDPADELNPPEADKAADKSTKPEPKKEDTKPNGAADAQAVATPPDTPEKSDPKPDAAKGTKPAVVVTVDFTGIESRQWEIPVPPGNLSRLKVTEKYLFFTDRAGSKTRLVGVEIKNKDVEVGTIMDEIRSYQLSHDRKKLAVLKADPIAKTDALYVFEAGTKAPDKLDKARVSLAGLKLSYAPRENWRQVLLRLKPADGQPAHEIVVTPISSTAAQDLRYDDWELSRRESVDQAGDRKIGYVHLRAMGSSDIAQWARDFYPVFDRQGLILDLRHNRGGNIDSWILNRLMRKAWMFWAPRDGEPYWNMQGAFRGHLVVLINEWTASDGETAANGVRRLGLGTLIGTRTWGGGVWLRGANGLVDKGIASAAEFGTYAPEGPWVVEGPGIDPDIVVDNLPHATFNGKDAPLDAAIKLLQEKIAADPRPVPKPPAYPNKALPLPPPKR